MNIPFSVLISLYKTNDPVFFEEAMASIFDQTYPPSEIVLVIDGEKTEAQQTVIDNFAKKYPEILKVIPLEKNIGQGPALNEGLKHCSYELVARMDTDDISKPCRFEKQIAVFERNPKIDICGSWIDEFENSPDTITAVRKLPETHDELKRYAKRRCPLNHPSVVYKKSKIIECGGYEPIGFLDDYLLWMKMLANNSVFYNIQESLLLYRASNMYKRRGGIMYALNECKLQRRFYKLGTISIIIMIRNILIRAIVRVMPNSFRVLFYKIFLRAKPPRTNTVPGS
jgi:glycosyltransferase involved in cell wall biosynthesis